MTLQKRCHVVGLKPYSGTIRETNESYSGKHLYLTCEEPGVTGVAVDTQKVSDKVKNANTLVVGSDYVFTFEATEYNGDTRLRIIDIQPFNK